jgi:hypothetical protein
MGVIFYSARVAIHKIDDTTKKDLIEMITKVPVDYPD